MPEKRKMKQLREYDETQLLRKIVRRAVLLILGLILCVLLTLLAGCVSRNNETEKLRDLEFTVIDKDLVPPEMEPLLKQNREKPFQITYADQGWLYIAEGYGEQPTSGYSVAVDQLYETETQICVHTYLMGPEKGEKITEKATWPYIVIKLEYIDKDVYFK